MGATTITIGGRSTAVPGVESIVDASALEAQGLAATGTVALIGTSIGGKPNTPTTDSEDFIKIKNPRGIRDNFRGGDLFEGTAILFDPSSDEAVGGGAQEVIAMKVDQDTRSSATLSNAIGNALTVTSADYGPHTTAISVEIAAGTNGGRKVTVKFEGVSEIGDDIGVVSGVSTAMLGLKYDEPASGAQGWDTMTADILSTGARCYATRSEVGRANEITSNAAAGTVVRASSSNAADTQQLTIYGLDAGNVPLRETITLNGTTVVSTITVFTKVHGAELSAAAAGTITITNAAGTPVTLITMAVGTTLRGLVTARTMYVANTQILVRASGASTADVIYWGRAQDGSLQSERVALNGTTVVRSVRSWSEIEVLVLGDVGNTLTLTFDARAAETQNLVQNTLAKVKEYFDARQVTISGTKLGFTFSMKTGQTAFLTADMDLTADGAVNIDGVEGLFGAVLKAIETFLDDSSVQVDAAMVAFVRKVWTVTVATAAAATYTVTIDGTAISTTLTGTPTLVQVATAIADAINNTPAVMNYVTALASGATVAITGVTPRSAGGVVVTEADTNLTLALTTAQSGSGQAPANTTVPAFLSGGTDVAPVFQDWKDALDRLRLVDVRTIVVLTGDPAVHAALEAHCAYMAGAGKSERDAVVGLSALDSGNAPTGVLPTKTSIKSQIIAINSRHIRAIGQNITRASAVDGKSTTFPPWFAACLAAGSQAATAPGTPLTRKTVKVTKFGQDSSWDPSKDADEMVRAGAMILEKHRAGIRWVRNLTTHLTTSNLAFVEASTNEATNVAVFNFRNRMEILVGTVGFAGTPDAAKNLARGVLNDLMDNGTIVAWKKETLKASLDGDKLSVSVEISPAIPINFVVITIHLVPLRIAA